MLEENLEIAASIDGGAVRGQAISMSGGRVGLVWTDGRGGNNGVALYYQIVDALGQIQHNVHGIQLVPDNEGFPRYEQEDAMLSPDGNGGFFASFVDLRAGVKQIRLAHVNSEGEIACSDAGAIVWDVAMDQQQQFVCPDGEGGCFVTWSGFDESFTLDVYVMRMNGQCGALWPQPVRITYDGIVDDNVRGVLSDGDGACIVCWKTGGFSQFDVMAAKVSADGTVQWNFPVCDADRNQQDAVITGDGTGGAYFAWNDNRIQENERDIYAQHILADGTVEWADNGIPVCTELEPQRLPKIAYSADNGLYVVWQDFRSGTDLDLYAQRIDMSGNLQWEASGLEICTETGDQNEVQIALNNAGGIFLTWTDGRGFYYGIYGMDLLPDGTPTREWWVPSEGGLIGDENQTQYQPAMAFLSEYQMLVAWVDWRSSGAEPLQNLYMQSVLVGYEVDAEEDIPQLPSRYALHQNYPNPFNPNTAISFELAQAGAVSLVVYDLLGREVASLLDKTITAGVHSLEWDAGSLPTGVYIYRLRAGEFSKAKKMVLLR
jgi:hypothetical protein